MLGKMLLYCYNTVNSNVNCINTEGRNIEGR